MRIEIFTKSEQLPELIDGSVLHSALTFRSYESNKTCKPYMFVAYDDNSKELGHILVIKRRRFTIYRIGITISFIQKINKIIFFCSYGR